MKRIAVELFGLSRNYEKAFFSFFINYLQPAYYVGDIVDVFIHTWSVSDTDDVVWHNPRGDKQGQELKDGDIKDIIEKYRPKKLLVDKPLAIPKDLLIREKLAKHNRSYNSIISSFYSRYKANELRKEYEKERGVKYDWVMMTRFDISFDKVFSIYPYIDAYKNDCKVAADKNAIFTAWSPFKMCGMAESENIECCTDLIVFTSPKSMDAITRFYPDLKNEIIDMQFVSENLYNLETLWRKYWKLQGLEHIKVKYIENQDFHIIRAASEDSASAPTPVALYKSRVKNDLKSVWRRCKPLISWALSFLAIPYCLLKIAFKSLLRIGKCV